MDNHLFSDLRKGCQHPLLLRKSVYTDAATLSALARALMKTGAFTSDGNSSFTAERVMAELVGMSDYEIHSFCTEWCGRTARPIRNNTLTPEEAADEAAGRRRPGLLGSVPPTSLPLVPLLLHFISFRHNCPILLC